MSFLHFCPGDLKSVTNQTAMLTGTNSPVSGSTLRCWAGQSSILASWPLDLLSWWITNTELCMKQCIAWASVRIFSPPSVTWTAGTLSWGHNVPNQYLCVMLLSGANHPVKRHREIKAHHGSNRMTSCSLLGTDTELTAEVCLYKMLKSGYVCPNLPNLLF